MNKNAVQSIRNWILVHVFVLLWDRFAKMEKNLSEQKYFYHVSFLFILFTFKKKIFTFFYEDFVANKKTFLGSEVKNIAIS